MVTHVTGLRNVDVRPVAVDVHVTRYEVVVPKGRSEAEVRERPARVPGYLRLMVRNRPSDGLEETWVLLDDGPQSFLLTYESIGQMLVAGWWAQLGTRPVRVDGVWGGRNYPAMWVPPTDMRRLFTRVLNALEEREREETGT